MKIEVSKRRRGGKFTNMWKLNTHSRTTNGLKKKAEGNQKTQIKWKHSMPKPRGLGKSSSERK